MKRSLQILGLASILGIIFLAASLWWPDAGELATPEPNADEGLTGANLDRIRRSKDHSKDRDGGDQGKSSITAPEEEVTESLAALIARFIGLLRDDKEAEAQKLVPEIVAWGAACVPDLMLHVEAALAQREQNQLTYLRIRNGVVEVIANLSEKEVALVSIHELRKVWRQVEGEENPEQAERMKNIAKHGATDRATLPIDWLRARILATSITLKGRAGSVTFETYCSDYGAEKYPSEIPSPWVSAVFEHARSNETLKSLLEPVGRRIISNGLWDSDLRRKLRYLYEGPPRSVVEVADEIAKAPAFEPKFALFAEFIGRQEVWTYDLFKSAHEAMRETIGPDFSLLVISAPNISWREREEAELNALLADAVRVLQSSEKVSEPARLAHAIALDVLYECRNRQTRKWKSFSHGICLPFTQQLREEDFTRLSHHYTGVVDFSDLSMNEATYVTPFFSLLIESPLDTSDIEKELSSLRQFSSFVDTPSSVLTACRSILNVRTDQERGQWLVEWMDRAAVIWMGEKENILSHWPEYASGLLDAVIYIRDVAGADVTPLITKGVTNYLIGFVKKEDAGRYESLRQ